MADPETQHGPTDLELMHAELLAAYVDGSARSRDIPQPLAQHIFGQFFPRNLTEALTYRTREAVLGDMQWAGRFSRLADSLHRKWGVDLWRLPSVKQTLVPTSGLQDKILGLWNRFFLSPSKQSPAILFIEEMERLVGEDDIETAISAAMATTRGKAKLTLGAGGSDRLELLGGIVALNSYFKGQKRFVNQTLGYRLFAPFYGILDSKERSVEGISSGLEALNTCKRLRTVFDGMKRKGVDAWKILVTSRADLTTIDGLLIALFHSQLSSPYALIENLEQTFVKEDLKKEDINKRLRFLLGSSEER